MSLVVIQWYIDYTGNGNFAGINSLIVLCLYYSGVFHSLYGNIVKILSTKGIWIIGIPTGGYSGKNFDVILVVARIKNQGIANRLEKSIISISFIRLLENIITFYVVFINVNQFCNAVFCKSTQRGVLF